jgi:hypothetical protein
MKQVFKDLILNKLIRTYNACLFLELFYKIGALLL